MSQERPFQRQAFFDEDDLTGARWWQESLITHADPVTRRAAMSRMTAIMIGVGAVGLLVAIMPRRRRYGSSAYEAPHSTVIEGDALELQKQNGWDVGHAGERLSIPGAATADAAGATDWAAALPQLAQVLAPAQSQLAPYYVPTLFQSLIPPQAAGLRSEITPVHDDDMDAAYARGEALATLFADPDAPAGTAVLLDAPGPISVAVAAGMAGHFDPVFLFDNWPHPAGVVPSHLALGAALYYLPRFLAARQALPQPAPPVFVADASRLNPYTDDPARFDNRYLLRVPSAESLQALGVHRLLYVRPRHGDIELDDLNDDFVRLQAAGIEIKIVALDDFTMEAPPAAGTSSTAAPAPAPVATRPTYYWGGHPSTHIWFWPTYGWTHTTTSTRPRPSSPPSLPPQVGSGATYRPAPRPTMFSSHTYGGTAGVGRQKPTGFGRVSVRSTPSEEVHGGGRSGSFGRTTSTSGG